MTSGRAGDLPDIVIGKNLESGLAYWRCNVGTINNPTLDIITL